jgi:predicted amidohydrolase
MRVAAIQQEPQIGDVWANLAACARLGDEAGRAGAELIVLPEFFTTGMGFIPALADASLPMDGPATELLRDLARRHGAIVGGSFLSRDADGEVRNAFLVATPQGIAGRHNKDLPTMWENCFYVGGSDDGVIPLDGLTLGVVLCLEFNRTATARRQRGRVDVVLGASSVWSVPDNLPGPIYRRLEKRMASLDRSRPRLARMVGAPVVEATHCGRLDSGTPWMPFMRYRTYLRGGAQIIDPAGRVIARREGSQGPGVVLADITIGRTAPVDPLPDRYWVEDMGLVGELLWRYQGVHGRRWYRRHEHRRAARLPRPPL